MPEGNPVDSYLFGWLMYSAEMHHNAVLFELYICFLCSEQKSEIS